MVEEWFGLKPLNRVHRTGNVVIVNQGIDTFTLETHCPQHSSNNDPYLGDGSRTATYDSDREKQSK